MSDNRFIGHKTLKNLAETLIFCQIPSTTIILKEGFPWKKNPSSPARRRCPQYQKQLRLQAARGRMLVDDLDAASAAFEVGYESASQFNREYSRLFGHPPMRDIRILRSPGAPPLESLSNPGAMRWVDPPK